MQRLRPILKIFLPFLTGMVLCHVFSDLLDFFQNKALLQVLLWIFIGSLGLYFVLILLKKNYSFLHYTHWFLSGMLAVLLLQPNHDLKHFSYANAEIYEAKINQVHLSNTKTSKFIRCELSVIYAHQNNLKKSTSGNILAFIDTAAWQDFKPNDVLLVQASPEQIRNQGNPGEFNLTLFWKTKGFEYQWFLKEEDVVLLEKGNYQQSFFDELKQGIVEKLENNLNGEVFAVAMGILLGDKSYLNLELKDAFSGAGAMHLLAVSGLHVGIFLLILQWIFKTFGQKLPRWMRFVFILAILWLYAGITGFSPSVNRAVTMFSFVALGTLLGRRYNSMDGLLASAMILLAVNPYYLFDIGFQLSYLAMLGIFMFSPLIDRSLNIQKKWLKFIWSGTAVALAAQLTTFPLTLYYFHQFPNYFLITNLGLMLISGVMMALGLGIVSLGSVPFMGTLIAMAFVVVVSALISFVQWVSDLPYAITRGFRIEIWEMTLLYFGIAILLWGLREKNRILLFSSLSIFTFFIGYQSFQAIRDEQTSEFLVLSNNDPTFFIRRGKAADLVVVSNKPDIESRTSFLKRSLDIYYGVNAETHFLEKKRGDFKNQDSSFCFALKNGVIQFDLKDESYALVYGDYFKESDLSKTRHVILGPWVNQTSIENITSKPSRWALKKKGAFRVAL
jgi:competence protein ComEC